MTQRTPRDWLHAPAFLRNRDPILNVLQRHLPKTGEVLEVGCGTGEHAVYMAPRLPGLNWQPSDFDPYCLDTAGARIAAADVANLRAPLALDVMSPVWPVGDLDAVVSINLVHIAPWIVAEALVRGAGAALRGNGVLYLYGPFSIGGRHTAPSNDSFDHLLKRHNPEWGVRDLDDLARAAAAHGLVLAETIDMPANNLSVFLVKQF